MLGIGFKWQSQAFCVLEWVWQKGIVYQRRVNKMGNTITSSVYCNFVQRGKQSVLDYP